MFYISWYCWLCHSHYGWDQVWYIYVLLAFFSISSLPTNPFFNQQRKLSSSARPKFWNPLRKFFFEAKAFNLWELLVRCGIIQPMLLTLVLLFPEISLKSVWELNEEGIDLISLGMAEWGGKEKKSRILRKFLRKLLNNKTSQFLMAY